MWVYYSVVAFGCKTELCWNILSWPRLLPALSCCCWCTGTYHRQTIQPSQTTETFCPGHVSYLPCLLVVVDVMVHTIEKPYNPLRRLKRFILTTSPTYPVFCCCSRLLVHIIEKPCYPLKQLKKFVLRNHAARSKQLKHFVQTISPTYPIFFLFVLLY